MVDHLFEIPRDVLSRMYKGNVAAIHHLFANKADLKKVYDAAGTPKDVADLKDALVDNNIHLDDAQIAKLCSADTEPKFFKALFEMQQVEIENYLNMQKKRADNPDGTPAVPPYVSTTANYYHAVLQQLKDNAAKIKLAADYALVLKEYNTNPDKVTDKDDKKNEKGQLWSFMNHEYVIYTFKNEAQDNFGSKAENVRYFYYRKQIEEAKVIGGGTVSADYVPMEKFVADHQEKFPGGFHAQVNLRYEQKKVPKYYKPGARAAGKGHHVTIVNLDVSKKDLAAVINEPGHPMPNGTKCFVHEVQFTIGKKLYGIYTEYTSENKPLTLYKVELNADGSYKKNSTTGGFANRTLLLPEEAMLSDKGTQLAGRYADKRFKLGSVTEAFAMSLRDTQTAMLGSDPDAPIIVGDDAPSVTPHSGTGMHVGSAGSSAVPTPLSVPPMGTGTGAGLGMGRGAAMRGPVGSFSFGRGTVIGAAPAPGPSGSKSELFIGGGPDAAKRHAQMVQMKTQVDAAAGEDNKENDEGPGTLYFQDPAAPKKVIPPKQS